MLSFSRPFFVNKKIIAAIMHSITRTMLMENIMNFKRSFLIIVIGVHLAFLFMHMVAERKNKIFSFVTSLIIHIKTKIKLKI